MRAMVCDRLFVLPATVVLDAIDTAAIRRRPIVRPVFEQTFAAAIEKSERQSNIPFFYLVRTVMSANQRFNYGISWYCVVLRS